MSPETDYLLRIAYSGDDGVLYTPGSSAFIVRPLLAAKLVELLRPEMYARPGRDRLYATPAGRKAAKMIREAAQP